MVLYLAKGALLVRLGATGSHMTSHRLQSDKTFLRVRLSGTSAGKRTWPLRKKEEERVSKKMCGDESHSVAAATAAFEPASLPPPRCIE